MKIKDVFAWTNPVAWVICVPIVVGVALACMCNNLFKNTGRITKEIVEDMEE